MSTAHVTTIEPAIAGGFRWVCSCGARGPITFGKREAAVRGAWAHRTAEGLA